MNLKSLLLLFLGACSSGHEDTFNVADWTMPALGKNRPIVWIIDSPAIIAVDVAELGLPVESKAYVIYAINGLNYHCEIHTPPLNDVGVMNLIRHELAHCVTGRFH